MIVIFLRIIVFHDPNRDENIYIYIFGLGISRELIIYILILSQASVDMIVDTLNTVSQRFL